MKLRWLLGLLGIVLGILAIFQVGSGFSSQAAQLPAPVVRIGTMTPGYIPPALPAVPTSANTSPDSIAQELDALAQKFGANLLIGPGWIHQLEHYTSDSAFVRGNLPTGQAIPNSFLLESWTHVDETDQVLGVVSLMKDEADTPIQVTVVKDGIANNLTLGVQTPAELGKYKVPGAGIAATMLQAKTWGSGVNRWDERDSDQRVQRIFSIRETYAGPIQPEGLSERVIASESRSAFDPETGRLLWSTSVLLTESGREIVTGRSETVVLEWKAEAPPIIVALLK